MNTIRCTIAITLLLLACLPKSLSAQTLTAPQPLNAVEAILAAVDKFPIVAIGEAHGLQEEADFITSLIRHPDFPNKVNAIVVEVGNAKYQSLVDKYVTGESVAPTLKPDLNAGLMLQLVEQRHPGSTFVIETHLGFGDRNAELEPRLSSWPKPSIALIKGTWLGALDAGFTSVSDVFITPDGNRVNPAQGRKKEDVADAYLYLGSVDSLTMSHPSPELYLDEAYFRELNRRHIIMTGQPLNLAELTKRKPKKYIDNFK